MGEGHRLSTLGRKLGGFLRLVGEQFLRHQGPQSAAALTFTTLLSLVPLMTVSLSVFYAFPIADRFQAQLQDWLFRSFVPAVSQVLQQHLQAFSDKAAHLSGLGFGMLLVVALMLMMNIDAALNRIWNARAPRSRASKFLIYWAVLTLGPVLIAVSMLASSWLAGLPLVSGLAASGAGHLALALTPLLASFAAFTLMYTVVPNVRVRFGHALAGGLVAALLFELAKHAFSLYLRAFPSYEAIYGALAVVPIFLVWLYLSWAIVLLGAEVAHGLRIYHWHRPNPRGRELGVLDAIWLLLLLDEAAEAGRARSLWELTAACPEWREDRVEALLAEMLKRGWVAQERDGDWLLARRASDLTLHEVLVEGGFPFPRAPLEEAPDEALGRRFAEAGAQLRALLDVPLSQFRLQRVEPTPLRRATPPE